MLVRWTLFVLQFLLRSWYCQENSLRSVEDMLWTIWRLHFSSGYYYFTQWCLPLWGVRLDGWTPVRNRHSAWLGSAHVFFYLEAPDPIFLLCLELFIFIMLSVGDTVRLGMTVWEHLPASLELCLVPPSHLLCLVFLWLFFESRVLYCFEELVCTSSGPLVWMWALMLNWSWINFYITCKSLVTVHYDWRCITSNLMGMITVSS